MFVHSWSVFFSRTFLGGRNTIGLIEDKAWPYGLEQLSLHLGSARCHPPPPGTCPSSCRLGSRRASGISLGTTPLPRGSLNLWPVGCGEFPVLGPDQQCEMLPRKTLRVVLLCAAERLVFVRRSTQTLCPSRARVHLTLLKYAGRDGALLCCLKANLWALCNRWDTGAARCVCAALGGAGQGSGARADTASRSPRTVVADASAVVLWHRWF